MFPSSNLRLQFSPGETIYFYEGIIYLCLEGQIVLSTLHDTGEEAILGLITAGMPFGSPLSGVQFQTATALTAVRLQTLTLPEVFESPERCRQLIEACIERLRFGEAFLTVANRHRVDERFRALLLLLAEQFGRQTEEGIYLEIRLTHRQIASAINTTRVTVTRLIQHYRRQGLIADRQQQFLIPDLQQLRRPRTPYSRPRPVDPA